MAISQYHIGYHESSGETVTAFPRLPRWPAASLAMAHQGGVAVHQRPHTVEYPCTRRSLTAATGTRCKRFVRFDRRPVHIGSAGPFSTKQCCFFPCRHKKITFASRQRLFYAGRTRTPDLLVRSQSLYPAELPARTHLTCSNILPQRPTNCKHFFRKSREIFVGL